MLDAPNLLDNFYLNLLDWGSKNILSVALSNEVYLLNTETFQTQLLMSLSENVKITSLSWINSGTVLAIGNQFGEILLYDTIKLEKIRSMSGNYGRVGTLSWNNYILSSGGKDQKIFNHDVRIKKHIISQLKGHKGEVCQLKYNNDGLLLASGGNDNLCLIWDVRKINNKLNDISNYNEINGNKPLITINYHLGAVKAISWCPWIRNFIATGGGNNDQSIKFFNVDNNNLVNCINTGSQVCCLLWNKREKELISSHGFNKNYICIWNYPKMNKVTELKGHMMRVLYLTMSPDECFIASGAGDETLRFWRINDKIVEISKDEDDDLFLFSHVR
jgi:cell division cycle protein 20 (cofactor of APC complex)